MTRPAPAIAVTFIKKAEACVLTAYQDSKGVWTIGWGHTGPEVKKGLVITRAKAASYLAADIDIAAGRLAGVLKADVLTDLTDHQYAALLSFVFNLGADPTWAFWKVVNGRKWTAVPAYMARFNKAKIDGKYVILPGLQHRRAAEGLLWNTDDVAQAIALVKTSTEAQLPSSETREMATPPEPVPSKPLITSKGFMSSVASAIGVTSVTAVNLAPGAANSIQSLAGKLDPIADHVDGVRKMRDAMLMLVALITVCVPFFIWLKDRKAKTA